jgi:hypothetical protein
MNIPPRLFALAAALVVTASAQVNVVSDNFTDGTRSSGEDFTAGASSLIWRQTSSTASDLSASTNALVLTNITANRNILSYFRQDSAGSGSPLQLGVGETMTVSFNLTISGTISTSANLLRVGLFNSYASSTDNNASSTSTRQIATDGLGTSSSTYANYGGYLFGYQLGSSNLTQVQSRDFAASNNTLLSQTISAKIVTLGSTSAQDYDFIAGNTYAFTLTFSRTGSDAMSLATSITGTFFSGTGLNYSVADSASVTHSFDTFALYAGSGLASSLTLDDFSVQHTAVPEPSTYVLLLGGVALAGTIFWRARRANSAGPAP